MRLVEFSVLGNHLHLIVEADSNDALSRGMQGLGIRLACALNATLDRRGAVFTDHYHSRLLRSPTELVRAIRYVIQNAAHHYRDPEADHFSSRALDSAELLIVPKGWLLKVGWSRVGPRDRIEPATARLSS